MNQREPRLDNGQSDAEAIVSSLGAIANMTLHADRMLMHAACFYRSEKLDAESKRIHGDGGLDRWSALLKDTRQRIDKVMQDMGDTFNGCDACSETMISISTPVFEVLKKRSEGVSLDD